LYPLNADSFLRERVFTSDGEAFLRAFCELDLLP
jgi:hypothetical protein